LGEEGGQLESYEYSQRIYIIQGKHRKRGRECNRKQSKFKREVTLWVDLIGDKSTDLERKKRSIDRMEKSSRKLSTKTSGTLKLAKRLPRFLERDPSKDTSTRKGSLETRKPQEIRNKGKRW